MNKGLEALKSLKKAHYVDGRLPLIDRVRIEIIEKELVAFDFFLDNTIIDLGFDEEENAYCVTINGGKILISEEEYNLIKEVKQSE